MKLISGRYVITMDRERRILENAAIAVDADRIVGIDTFELMSQRYPSAEIIGGDAFAILPGLVNSHMHLSCGLFRGYIDDMPLLEHDVRFLFPGQRAMNDRNVYQASLLSAVELLKYGCTTTADAYLQPQASARAMVDSGIRGIVSPAMMDTWKGGEDGPLVTSTEEALRQVRALRDEWHGAADGRIAVWPAPFTDLSASPELMKASGELAREWGSGIQIHLCETLEGVNIIKRRHGMRVFEFADSCGLFDDNIVVAAHCCWVSEPDIAIMKRHNVSVAYCPSSESKMADGLPPVPRLLSDGINVSIAIDATCVCNSADLLREAKLGAVLQKVRYPYDSEVIPAEEALEMITTLPAKALGMQDDIGSLAVGKKADVIAVRIDRAHFVPLLRAPRQTVINHLIYSASGNDVEHVFVDGRQLVRDGELVHLDERRLIADTQAEMLDFIEASGIAREITRLKWGYHETRQR
jgi:5-methylthioadenosine/S-adenosylhomocysteine deaminase